MQTNQSTYGFAQTGSYQPQKVAPGLKMTYGNKANQAQNQFQIPLPTKKAEPAVEKQGLFGRLVEKIWHMVSEEATDRPIGIAQLTHKTFQPHQEVGGSSFFRNGQTLQDYRFKQLVDPNQ
jgi:hypothetical protein